MNAPALFGQAEQGPAPPHNIEVEQALLGALLHNPRDGLAIARFIVKPDHFFEPAHQRIYSLMLEFDREGRAPTPQIIASATRSEMVAEDLSLTVYLGRLASGATTVLNLPDYARTVRDLAVSREAIAIADALSASTVGEGALNPFAAVSEAVGRCDSLLAEQDRTKRTDTDLAGAMREALGAAQQRRDAKGEPDVTTGLKSLDRAMGGLWRGDLVVLAGRPSMGKSAVMETLQINTARAGHGSATFSYEMGAAELGMRAAAIFASERYTADRLEYAEFRKGVFSERHRQIVEAATEEAGRLPVRIVDASGMTVHDIASRARRIAADMERKGHSLDVLLVDYLQLVEPTGRYAGNPVREIGEITKALKALARKLNACVVLLSQLSRAVEQRNDKRPQMSDLRESGNIEQDADVCCFLYREAYYLQNKPDRSIEDDDRLEQVRNVIDFIIGKQRHGPTCTVKMFGDLATNVIADLAEDRSQANRGEALAL